MRLRLRLTHVVKGSGEGSQRRRCVTTGEKLTDLKDTLCGGEATQHFPTSDSD